MPELHWISRPDATADEAVAAFARLPSPDDSSSPDRIGLLYSPRACRFARLHDGKPCDEHNREIALRDVFELRFFDAHHELRWRNDSAGKGRAVILGELPVAPPDDVWKRHSLPFLEKIESRNDERGPQYLLWGTVHAGDHSALAEGWSRLSEARIGELRIPHRGDSPSGRLVLRAIEYLADGDDDGNVVVVEQRLTGLAPYQETAST